MAVFNPWSMSNVFRAQSFKLQWHLLYPQIEILIVRLSFCVYFYWNCSPFQFVYSNRIGGRTKPLHWEYYYENGKENGTKILIYFTIPIDTLYIYGQIDCFHLILRIARAHTTPISFISICSFVATDHLVVLYIIFNRVFVLSRAIVGWLAGWLAVGQVPQASKILSSSSMDSLVFVQCAITRMIDFNFSMHKPIVMWYTARPNRIKSNWIVVVVS